MTITAYTIVLHTDGLYYVGDRAKDDYESIGFRTEREAAAYLDLLMTKEPENE